MEGPRTCQLSRWDHPLACRAADDLTPVESRSTPARVTFETYRPVGAGGEHGASARSVIERLERDGVPFRISTTAGRDEATTGLTRRLIVFGAGGGPIES